MSRNLSYKKNSGKASISYPEAVKEALCFGWIDSKVNTLDNERYMQIFTPRKAKSVWSAQNMAVFKMVVLINNHFVERSEYPRGRISEYWERFLDRETRTAFLKYALKSIWLNLLNRV